MYVSHREGLLNLTGFVSWDAISHDMWDELADSNHEHYHYIDPGGLSEWKKKENKNFQEKKFILNPIKTIRSADYVYIITAKAITKV